MKSDAQGPSSTHKFIEPVKSEATLGPPPSGIPVLIQACFLVLTPGCWLVDRKGLELTTWELIFHVS